MRNKGALFIIADEVGATIYSDLRRKTWWGSDKIRGKLVYNRFNINLRNLVSTHNRHLIISNIEEENKNMKATRQGVFETNSSSTHSICIAKSPEINLPKSINFEFDEFRWEVSILKTTRDKASYLFTGLFANKRDKDFLEIVDLLESKGIEVSFEEKVLIKHTIKVKGEKDYSYETDNCGHHIF